MSAPSQETGTAPEPEKQTSNAAGSGTPNAGLDAGTYEVLRSRLKQHATELARRAELLNIERLNVFGSTELRLIGSERIRTENNCVPRDIISVGGLMLFGYNVFIGLKLETKVEDVFALERFSIEHDEFTFETAGLDTVKGLFDAPAFLQHFGDLYRYYRETRLLQLRRLDEKLLAVFQTGPEVDNVRVLRWRVHKDGSLEYLDNLGERDHVFPPSHDFEWTETTRDSHVLGRHPHISIEDVVFVETVGGDLTIKVENNTETGEGIYSEPVDEPLQSLADADVHYTRVGPLLLLRIRPYNEQQWRHLVFNTQTKGVVRLDGIEQACLRLPEDQGIIFPDGYYLATGVSKTFDTDVQSLEFERVVRSPNGEDVLYVFYARAEGRTLLLPYNVIRKQVANPIACHGYSLFDDGTLVVFRANSEEPTRVHPMQVWQTPFQSDTYAAAQPTGSGPLERVGNADLVRGISDCLSVARMVDEMAPSTEVFEALIAHCTRVSDNFHWLDDADLGHMGEPLAEVRTTAEAVLDEFEKVQALTSQAAQAVSGADAEVSALLTSVRGEAPKTADAWVGQLAELRRAQGRVETLREMRYVDTARLDDLGSRLEEALGEAGRRTVEHLSGENAFDGYHADLERLLAESGEFRTVAEAEPLLGRLDEQAAGLGVVTEVVGSLEMADATVRTRILERIGEVLAGLNRARATLEGRRKELLSKEGRAEFAAEFGLLGQAITAALAVADTPDRCDEQMGKLLLQVETLEARFGEFDDFVAQLGEKRTDVYEAFSSRKQALLDERARHAERLAGSADRILQTVQRRVMTLDSLEAVNTYFVSDPMVAKLRSLVGDLRDVGDQVRAEEIEGRIKAARQEAGRSLRDRLDLYDDGGESIKLGEHRFAVNTQPVDLTLIPHDGVMNFAITGTDFRSPVTDPSFASTSPFWNQLLVSETPEVYRAEYLAASLLRTTSPESLQEKALSAEELLSVVRSAAESRYDEGYERGVHDHDAAAILDAVLRLHSAAGLLRYAPSARAAAQLFWAYGCRPEARATWTTRARSLARARTVFGRADAVDELCAELTSAVQEFATAEGLPEDESRLAGEYLFEELASEPAGFVSGQHARAIVDSFLLAVGRPNAKSRKDFEADLAALEDLGERYQLVSAWLTSFAATQDGAVEAYDLPEAVAMLLAGSTVQRYDNSVELSATVEGLVGTHPRVVERRLTFRLDEFLTRIRTFENTRVPAFRAYLSQRQALVESEKQRLRLEEYTPKVMSAFVRNRLLDEVYLPLIGGNLAKQLGASGDRKRTDQMGLLLLISPPGYGKTTLMEYIASRLGLVFVKVNGPALGHSVTSLDPAEAPNATARQEIEKISFALEMGNNTLLYLDDIQHTSPELLQKFISLCDAQRRIEGVWNGRTRTYDLRGKRFAVCMAGNPYTEQGKRFRIPDMLANRADVWNLGDVLSGRDELFASSYIENSLTSNPILAPLSTRERDDLSLLVRLARGDEAVQPDQLEHPYSAAELEQILSVLRKLARVQDLVLTVNQAYIASAAQSDDSRTEPPFQLQGSYRNMNKLAERVVPVMNDAELEAAIDDHYLGEAQTLTSGAEANLLKLAELRGRLSDEQAARWAEVKAGFRRAAALGGEGDDPMARAVGAMGLLADKVGAIESAINRATESR